MNIYIKMCNFKKKNNCFEKWKSFNKNKTKQKQSMQTGAVAHCRHISCFTVVPGQHSLQCLQDRCYFLQDSSGQSTAKHANWATNWTVSAFLCYARIHRRNTFPFSSGCWPARNHEWKIPPFELCSTIISPCVCWPGISDMEARI